VNLGRLERDADDQFSFQLAGIRHLALRPSDLPWEAVAQSLEDLAAFQAHVIPSALSVSFRQLTELSRSWAEFYDLPTAAEARRLCFMLSRYFEEIEADLSFRGIDLGELWRSRQWRRLGNLIDHLPMNCFFIEAIAQDDELAASMPEVTREHEERISQWSPELVALAALVDRLGTLISVGIAAAGGKPPDIPSYPRPVTAFQRAAERTTRETHERFVERLLPR
jgi:hypothetical protein